MGARISAHACGGIDLHQHTQRFSAGCNRHAGELSPEAAAEVLNAQRHNLEGDAPGNVEEPYTFNLSDPNRLPNQNLDRRRYGIMGGYEQAQPGHCCTDYRQL